jgi:hypothetical protein
MKITRYKDETHVIKVCQAYFDLILALIGGDYFEHRVKYAIHRNGVATGKIQNVLCAVSSIGILY